MLTQRQLMSQYEVYFILFKKFDLSLGVKHPEDILVVIVLIFKQIRIAICVSVKT